MAARYTGVRKFWKMFADEGNPSEASYATWESFSLRN